MVPLTEMTGLSPAMQVTAKDMTARAVAQLDPYVQDLNTALGPFAQSVVCPSCATSAAQQLASGLAALGDAVLHFKS